MPPEIVRAIIGGVQKVIHRRLLPGGARVSGAGPAAVGLDLSPPPPPGPRGGRRRPACDRGGSRSARPPSNPAERLLRALAAVVAEKGYQETTVAEIVERAKTSQRTFYEHFATRKTRWSPLSTAAQRRCWRRRCRPSGAAATGRSAVHDAQEAMFRFAAEEPEYGRLGAVEMYAAGKRALQTAGDGHRGHGGAPGPRLELAPDARRSPPRRSAAPSTRCSTTSSRPRARAPAGAGTDGLLRDPGPFPRRRGGLRGGSGVGVNRRSLSDVSWTRPQPPRDRRRSAAPAGRRR